MEQKIYCGPNLPRYGLMSYQVFLGEYPGNVQEAIRDIPEIEHLIVEVKELETLRRRIKESGTVEKLYYERVKGKVKVK